MGLVPCENPAEFERVEPRLSAPLRVDRFCTPPDHRHVRQDAERPRNALLYIPAYSSCIVTNKLRDAYVERYGREQ